MTPDLLDEGTKRREAYLAKQAANQMSGASGGQSASYGRVVSASDEVDVAHGGILYVEDITVSFDGFRALNKLTLNIAVGELRCIIGPNGAGKTTMMDVITGKTKPDSDFDTCCRTHFTGVDDADLRHVERACHATHHGR